MLNDVYNHTYSVHLISMILSDIVISLAVILIQEKEESKRRVTDYCKVCQVKRDKEVTKMPSKENL